MTTPQEKLTESLEALKEIQDRGVVAIQTSELKRLHRERLMKNGFLQEVMKGWYIPTRPDEPVGESTSWYASFWGFCAAYLRERFGNEWCLSPEQSLSLHAGNQAVPRQLLVRALKGGNKPTTLPYDTSLLDMRAALPAAEDIKETDGLRLFSLPAALIATSPGLYKNSPTDARAALATVRDASELLHRLLEGGHSTIAGRLAGAFRNIGRDRIAWTTSSRRCDPLAIRSVSRIRLKPGSTLSCYDTRYRPTLVAFASCGRKCARQSSSDFRSHPDHREISRPISSMSRTPTSQTPTTHCPLKVIE